MKEERQPLHGCLLCLGTSPRNTQLSSGSHHSHLSSLFREEAIVETLGSASPFAPAEHIEDVLELNPGIQIYVDLRKDGKNIKTVDRRGGWKFRVVCCMSGREISRKEQDILFQEQTLPGPLHSDLLGFIFHSLLPSSVPQSRFFSPFLVASSPVHGVRERGARGP